ncbi:hypothetical protein TrRE_jg10662 [Triparma retinervis]|uniref:Uncharacterized protein n=1 Tax=Triparma retinervis TaxID=2557542 RepID=A0A9W6Z909_9STRA|nr:hypothetical protein TrRE_jg10662 [Triparma retinervis]
MTLINKLILNRDVHSELQSCAKDLEDLTKRDVNDIANGMILLKWKEASDSEAIDAFFRFYPSMDQLNAKQDGLLREVVLNLFHRLHVDQQQKWAQAKLFVAAGLSMGDLLTDMLMVTEYFGQGERNYALHFMCSVA